MIESIIATGLQILLPVVNFFVRDAEKKKALKETMIKLIQSHGQNIAKNAELHIEYQAMVEKAKEQKKKEV